MKNIEYHSSHKESYLKLSAVFKADNFVYALFDQENILIGYSSENAYGDFEKIIQSLGPDEIKVAIKTVHFGHFGAKENFPFDRGSIFIDKMTGQDIWCAYEAPFLPQGASVRHFSTLLNHHFFANGQNVFHIHMDEDQMHFYLAKKGRLLLYNVFPFATENDLLYYHTFLTQSFEVNTQHSLLTISGEMDLDSKAYNALSNYHHRIEFLPGNRYAPATEEVKPHYYFDHLLNIQCG